MEVIVLFDSFCPLCRALASLLQNDLPLGWQVLAFQQYSKQHRDHRQQWRPNELQILYQNNLLVGVDAWDFLVKHAPQMKAYQRLAAKLGMSPPQQARLLRWLGHSLRQLCSACPHKEIFFRRRGVKSRTD